MYMSKSSRVGRVGRPFGLGDAGLGQTVLSIEGAIQSGIKAAIGAAPTDDVVLLPQGATAAQADAGAISNVQQIVYGLSPKVFFVDPATGLMVQPADQGTINTMAAICVAAGQPYPAQYASALANAVVAPTGLALNQIPAPPAVAGAGMGTWLAILGGVGVVAWLALRK